MTLREAAHVTHDIAADAVFFNTLLTFAGGVVAGGLAAYFTGGAAALKAGAQGCSIGGNLGTWIDHAIGTSIVGKVEIGVASILVGPDHQPAASNDQAVHQAGCDDQPIGEGSTTVQAEKWSFSRRGDRTLCGHVIVQGCPTVYVGGDPWLGGVPVAGFAEQLNRAVNLACQGVGIASSLVEGDLPGAVLGAAEAVATAGGEEALAANVGLGGDTRALLTGDTVVDRVDGAIGVVTGLGQR